MLVVPEQTQEGTRGWRVEGRVTVETFDGVRCFAVRPSGSLHQDVPLQPNLAGAFAVLIGEGQSDRIDASGSITGLPYLYATVASADRRRILDYWQGQGMLARPERRTDWVRMWGVFRIPEDAAYVSVQLKQAEARGSPHDNSAARFAGVQLHIFPTRAAADRFARAYATR